MGCVLFAWELGAGLGHLNQILPLADGLAKAGHRVFVALRDLSGAQGVFARTGVCYLQAPIHHRPPRTGLRRTLNFAHLLFNVGFADDHTLLGLASAWRNLYRLVRPDLIVFDHSPAALLASRGGPARRIVIGSGFCCPPDHDPMPSLRPWAAVDGERLRADERPILDRVNRLLAFWKQPPLTRLGQLYSDVDDTFLTTFAELDHFPGR